MNLRTHKGNARCAAHTPGRKLGTARGSKREVLGVTLQNRNRRLLQRNPLCVHCLAEVEQGTRQIALAVDEWDHIIPLRDGGADRESNLQGLCFAHHRAKSALEEARWGAGMGWGGGVDRQKRGGD